MARDFNQNRNTNARLIQKDIDTFGKRWAVEDGADGYSAIDVVVTDTTQDVKLYLEGSNDITVFPVASDVSKLCKNALTSFPKINTIFLFSATKVNIEEQTEGLGDYLSYLSLLSKIYVPSALLDRYKSTYSNLSTKFDIIIEDLTITIGWENNNTLTSEEITRQLNMLESAYLNQATKLVIDDRYTDYIDIVWAYNFTEKCSTLNNNIWHGTDKIDLTSKTLSGSDELLESDIDNFIDTISVDKLSGVLELHFEGFSDMSVALTYDYSALPNLEYVWLDNLRCSQPYKSQGIILQEYVESMTNNAGSLSTNGLYAPTGTHDIKFSAKAIDGELPRWTNLISGDNLVIRGFGNNDGPFGLTLARASEIIYWGGSQIISNKGIFNVHLENGNNYATINGGGLKQNTNNLSGNANIYSIGNNGLAMYGFELSESGVKKINLLPAYDTINEKGCMIDSVTRTILYTTTADLVAHNIKWEETYFYPLSSLEAEYDARLTQTFYFDYNGILPSYPDYQLTYYTDINCTTSILPENMQSGTRYYVKAVMVTLTIQGSGTLTSAIVESQVAKASSGVTKVIVPVDFTAYDSGSITAIQNGGLTNLRYLETIYESGAMELDLQGDIVSKITSINKTLDEALVYARSLPATLYSPQNDNDVIIVPPLRNLLTPITGCANLVYVNDVTFYSSTDAFGSNCPNLVEGSKIKIISMQSSGGTTFTMCFGTGVAPKRLELDFTDCNYSIKTLARYYGSNSSLEKIIMTNLEIGLYVHATSLDRQALIDLINSLGTPATQQTLDIGATNLAKLTADDVAIATAKNWVLQ